MSTRHAGVDVGGTFTDVIVHASAERTELWKALSTPADYDRAVVDALRDVRLGELAEVVPGTRAAPSTSRRPPCGGPRRKE